MKIMLIDDHPIFLDGLKFIIESIEPGSNCMVASNASHALEILETDSSFDLIMVDLAMPGIDGVAFLAAVARRELVIPTIILSGRADARDVHEALEAGALGFVPKSFDRDELQQAIRTVLDGDIFLPAGLANQLARIERQPDDARQLEMLGITRRQAEVLALIAQGQSNKQIAQTLYVSEPTVKFHVSALFKALGATNRTDLLVKAGELGLDNTDEPYSQ